MKISDDLRQLSAAINYLSQKRKDILDDLKARPERHGCPYFIGQVFETQDGVPVFDENGKIAKTDGYFKPDLAKFLNKNKEL